MFVNINYMKQDHITFKVFAYINIYFEIILIIATLNNQNFT